MFARDFTFCERKNAEPNIEEENKYGGKLGHPFPGR